MLLILFSGAIRRDNEPKIAQQQLTLNDWSRGEQWILFPSNLEILGKQNSLFPKGPVIKWFVI